MAPQRVPHDVAQVIDSLEAFLDAPDSRGRVPCNARCGIYVFYDYDGEPIYVGQTKERLRSRIRRHLTNQRTDAVAMNVLDPFEVAEVEVYPFFDLETRTASEDKRHYDQRVKDVLSSAEHTVYQKVLRTSRLGAVLNEKDISARESVNLPEPQRGRIVPNDLYEQRRHPDVRIARRASTIASLAKVISERDVSGGLRRTLWTQARRLELLARIRLAEFAGEIPVESPEGETGD